MTKPSLLHVATLLLLSACAMPTVSHPTTETSRFSAEEGAIRDARSAQNRAIVGGDVDRVASFWTEDVTIRRGLGQLITGSSAYRELFASKGGRDSNVVYQREPSAIEVSPVWPLAFETGRWEGRIGAAPGSKVIGGLYSAQWVRRRGRWLIRSEVFVALDCAGVGCSYSAAP